MARLIGIAAIPLLTRIYSPSDYGALSVYSALVAVIAPMLTLRYVLAVPLPRSDGMAANLMMLSGLLLIGVTVIISLLAWLFGDIVLGWMSMQILAPWWWLVILGAVGLAMYEALSLWATRRRAYRVISQTKVLQSALSVLVKVCLGLAAIKPFGLLLGHLVEQSGGISSFWLRFRHDFRANAHRIRRSSMRLLARYYRGFPTFRMPSQFLLVFSTQAPIMFAAALFGASATGQLGLALMALAIPSNLIGQSVGQAFYGEIARLPKGSEVRIKALAYSVQKKLFLVGLPLTLVLVLLGEPLFHVAFGARWTDAGRYASILAPFILLQLTSAPLVQILNIYNAQGAFLIINAIRAAGLLAIYQGCLIFSLPQRQFIYLLSGFLFGFYLLITLYILHVVNKAAARHMEAKK
ncbi:oligosaccharide flippase family protein [Luteimonas sp. S4-F44]|uniref:lipopolysaccharide biosynthesis protein n=1 Tax=Luteimonas sp. S4-F44 TaxID=2925842 RepID=UPI001F52E427|nr:oligosaccharide flippase family protein [Luteimonas sp. S4-F44]UNK42214.1 oligosaccharide flippase family protein [Luteimonas sp. S4-F44]